MLKCIKNFVGVLYSGGMAINVHFLYIHDDQHIKHPYIIPTALQIWIYKIC